MIRINEIRERGAIPERRHDSFLLALLLAVAINLLFFAVQALLPRIAALLQQLAGRPAVVQEETLPFVLVDSSFLDEELDPDVPADATANLNRMARQEEATPDLSDLPRVKEGVDELLTMPVGNPGELFDPGVDSAGMPEIEVVGDAADTPSESREEPEDAPDAHELAIVPVEDVPSEEPPPPDPAEPPPVPESAPPEPPLPDIPFAPAPVAEPLPEPLPEPPPPEEYLPPPPMEETPSPAPAPEAIQEPPPEPIPEPVPERVEPPPDLEPVPQPEPVEEIVDLAALPASETGFFDPGRQDLRPTERPVPPQPQQQQYVQPQPYYQPQPQPQEFYRPQPQQRQEYAEPSEQPQRVPRRNRATSRPPPIKTIGGASTAGGAPPRKTLSGRNTDMFGDPNMRLLMEQYPEYMMKMARQLQNSLNRVMVFYPNYYATGQSKIYFSLSPEGTVSYHDTVFPAEGVDDTLRMITQRTLLEAAPFDPPPPAMLANPAFKNMSLNVFIY